MIVCADVIIMGPIGYYHLFIGIFLTANKQLISFKRMLCIFHIQFHLPGFLCVVLTLSIWLSGVARIGCS